MAGRVDEWQIGQYEIDYCSMSSDLDAAASKNRTVSRLRRFILVRTRGRSAVAVLPLSPIHRPLFALSTRTKSHTYPNASSSGSSSSSNFLSVLNAALDAYEKNTKSKLLTHPLAAQLQSCDSPTAILSVLRDLIQQFDCRRTSDERLTNWLNPTINVLYAFSSTLGQGVGLVSLNQTYS